MLLEKNAADRLAQCRIATNIQFVKNAISAKCNKVKHSKMRYAHTLANDKTANIYIKSRCA